MEPDWTPKVLTEYEIGKCAMAIEFMTILDKPVVEVMTRRAERPDLEADLTKCLEIWDHTDRIEFWIRPTEGGRLRYGFYEHPWVLAALDFLDRSELGGTERAWISGLLFGYRPDAIQQFIDRQEVPNVRTDT